MKTLNTIKLTTLAVSLAFSGAVIAETQGNYAYTNDWQSSLAKEFTKLDASGNGLLMPAEASKGKAFNRKSFAAADADKDGTIDQAEYINHKTSMGATNQSGSAATSSNATNTDSMSTDSMSTVSDTGTSNADAEMSSANSSTTSSATDTAADSPDKTAEMSQDNTDTKKRSAGVVIEDSVITTKAKAAIFGTPDLKTLQISVETRQGEVTLTGMVDSAAAKMKAEEVVKSVEGVSAVMNNLEVKT